VLAHVLASQVEDEAFALDTGRARGETVHPIGMRDLRVLKLDSSL
jgi:hypothetical protein